MSRSGRRDFLFQCGAATVGACAFGHLPRAFAAKHPIGLHPAAFASSLPDKRTQCHLCPCCPTCHGPGQLLDGETCICNVRTNRGGTLFVTNYGRAAVLRKEPLAKNPLYHFHPGADAFAVAAPGCSLACKGCQSWQTALAKTEDVDTAEAPPARVASLAAEAGAKAISFTYTEPMMFYEYMSDIAEAAHARGIASTVVTGGYVNAEPLRALCGRIDAFSVSVKAFDDKTHMAYARGPLSIVQRSMETIRASGRWLEVVALIVPTVSDDLDKIRGFVRWVKQALGPTTPIHFDRFWPSYKLANLPPTPPKILEDARAMAIAEGLPFAYVGNLPGHWAANTSCPKCGEVLIRRVAFRVIENRVAGGACPSCRQTIAGIF